MKSGNAKQNFSEINPFPHLFTIGPANRDHEVAIRCGIAVFVPLLTLLLLDRIDLAIFASFGAFTAIYGRNLDHGPRLQMQLRVGLLMTVLLLLANIAGRNGISERENAWALVGCTTVVAGVVAVIAAYWQLRPTGSLFQIFAFAAVASVPAQPPFIDAAITTVATVVFALLIGVSSRVLFPKRRKPFQWPKPQVFSRAQRIQIWRNGAWHFVAAGAAGAIAILLSPVFEMQHNYWAMVAAVVPIVGHSTSYRISRGLQRVIGTLFGLILVALLLLLDLEPWQLILIIAVLQFGAEMLVARSYMIAQVVITPLALMATVLASSAGPVALDNAQILKDRAIETAIGSTGGVICVLLPWAWRKWVLCSDNPTQSIDLREEDS
ncbi:FUSC family protein [Gulosibacter chungangensis]|uniref:FUSC family protein n=1 Tax=Gulosibacter chungangensis TaxID=979746 RepID=UPI001CE3F7F2|nr:FUSC family protein [Gulosibacter chungangensis]